MEYKRKIILGTTALGVLTLSAVFGLVFSQQAVVQRQAQEVLLPGLAGATINSIEVGADVSLKKAPAWTMSFAGKNFSASSDRIETFVKTLTTLQRERLVSGSSDGKSFGLDQGYKTLKVSAVDGKVLVDLQVGKRNEQGNKVYVRLAGEQAIWETDAGFARMLDLDFNTWADLSLFPGKKAADLTRVTFEGRLETSDKATYGPFDIVKDIQGTKERWTNRLTHASTDSMSAWANLVPTFHFGAFVSPSETAAVAPKLGTLSLAWSDGSSSVVVIGPMDKQNRYRCSDGKAEFWINDWALAQILYR